jgi:hypothetical protein
LWDDEVEPLLLRARAGETVFAKNRRFYRERKGCPQQVYFDISYSPVRNSANEVEGIICILAETTERELGETHLCQSESQFRTLA